MGKLTRQWTPDEYARLFNLKRSDKSLAEIAVHLGRSVWAVRTKLTHFERVGSSLQRPQAEGQAYRASQEAMDDRDRRREARDRQTVTQAFCGDPPPGFSALERG